MAWRWLLVAALVSAATSAAAGKARFDNFRVLRVVPRNEAQLNLLRSIEIQDQGASFWQSPTRVNATVDIMVPPQRLLPFQGLMQMANISSSVFIEDVQRLIDEENRNAHLTKGFSWDAYHDLDAVNAYLDSLVEQNPGIVSPIVVGQTYEGRNINGVKISYKEGNPGIFVESGIHAREWITVAVTTWIVDQLLTSNDPEIRNVAENFDWYVVPSTNPDGYQYTHSTYRLWRKTRSPGRTCYGADPNRNWGYHWMDQGASSNECSETYAGKKAFSEIETLSLSEYLTANKEKFLVYLCFHSYSQLLMIPYGLDYEVPANYAELMEIGEKAIKALAEREGTQYEVGTIIDIIYPASGGSMDWVKKNLDIKYPFEWELRDKGKYGFLLPAEQIVPTALETFDSVLSILKDVQEAEGDGEEEGSR